METIKVAIKEKKISERAWIKMNDIALSVVAVVCTSNGEALFEIYWKQ